MSSSSSAGAPTLTPPSSSSFPSQPLSASLVQGPSSPRIVEMRSRIGHSMLFDGKRNQLFIFAGQRNDEYLSDFFTYDIATNQVYELTRDPHIHGGPDGVFTQRATMDPERGEIYVLSGLTRDRPSAGDMIKSGLWVYHIARGEWTKVYQTEMMRAEASSRNAREPRPRFAYQLIYHPAKKVHYLFGGNPGETDNPRERLDDFWRLSLERPSPDVVLGRALFSLRRRRCLDILTSGDRMGALQCLREHVVHVVHPRDPDVLAMFNALPALLLKPSHSGQDTPSVRLGSSGDRAYNDRTDVFDEIMAYFPPWMKQPDADLANSLNY
eukprot:TRINITY_DN7026_c0_g1_i1.p1 TRINITY_DN7026_c0_g1~~TRINITY_DN7026_c0_g1_i1.p1  ORF type:complete len:371 (-),score=82.87 TRINITY_DN7026_c0_g1_i1:27-1001(-)